MASEDTFSPMNPFALALNTQREIVNTTTETLGKLPVAEERLEQITTADVGQTPSEVVYTENKLELLHYEPQTDEQEQSDVPILIIYALINKPFILDLQPDRSVVRRLLEEGHDVYLIDWNEPSRLDASLTLDDYVNRYIENCVDEVRGRSGQDAINILGYCMGGTMAAMYAALHPEKVNALGLMAAGLCFEKTGGVLELWGDEQYYDPEDVTDTFGNMPADMLDIGFALMDPVANYISKYVRLYDNIEDEDFVENFARMERWLSEGIDVAGETYVQFLKDIYQDNKLHRNELYLNGKHVDVTKIDMPVLQITGEFDHLIPSEASKPFSEVIGSDDVNSIEHSTGHIGLSVSSSSHEEVWPDVAEWFYEKAPEPESDSDADSTADSDSNEIDIVFEQEVFEESENEEISIDIVDSEGGDEDADIETINGIGPTYASRLRDAGIETVDDLTTTDAKTIAEIAQVGVARAEDWLEQTE